MIHFHCPGVKFFNKNNRIGKFEHIVFQEFLPIESMVPVSRGPCCKKNVNAVEQQIMSSPSVYCAFVVGSWKPSSSIREGEKKGF